MKKCGKLLPWGFLLVAIMTCFSKAIWSDEIYSLELAKHSLIDLIQTDAMDVHPPLYYIILRFFLLIFGRTIDPTYLGKLFSIIPYLILILMGVFYIRKKYGSETALFFNLFIIGMPQMLTYSTEIRMYGWGMLFVTCAFFQIPYILNNDKAPVLNYLLLSVFSALAAYTHYFACASAIVIYLELSVICFIKKEHRKLVGVILSGLVVATSYIPWLFVFFRQVSAVRERYWIEPLSIKGIIGCILFLFSTNKVLEVLIIVLFTIGAIGILLCEKQNRIIAFCGLGVWIGTILLGVILSIVIRPIFIPRYVLGAAACMWLSVSIGLAEYKRNKKSKICSCAIVAASIICLAISMQYVKNEIEERNEIVRTLNDFDDLVDDNTVFLTDNKNTVCASGHYFTNNESILFCPQIDLDDPDGRLSETTLRVYSYCKLNKINSADELKQYSGKNILVLDRNGTIKSSLEEAGYKLDFIGQYWINRRNVDTYVIPKL
ncbi:glycosyltransferase family 39 protein [Butyrivibrio sp. WCD3002]|uniref:glycosyltransferase family 39 protein n=1 Tax=Butyrivibrio sp. WCD3002 TaxID=1280676 RepID=UPI000401C159|nr:glycosyltransferase family 39 protein [Butyrivibrio sp. WCD3002]